MRREGVGARASREGYGVQHMQHVRVTVLDDYQRCASRFADWGALDAEVCFIHDHLSGSSLIDVVSDSDVVVLNRERTPFSREVLDALPRLQLLVTTGSGNAAIDLAAARENGVRVCGTRNTSRSTIEIAWALILASMKHLLLEDQSLRSGYWQRTVPGDLAQRRLGLIGLGRLGAAMVPIARAFEMDVVAWSPHLDGERARAAGVAAMSKDDLLKTSDIISLHLRLSESTRGIIGAAELGLLRSGALLVNTSRGPIVDEVALLAAVREGRIFAALDVYDVEPLPLGHPLASCENVVLSPHLGYVSADSYGVLFGDVVEDIAAFYAGRAIRVLA